MMGINAHQENSEIILYSCYKIMDQPTYFNLIKIFFVEVNANHVVHYKEMKENTIPTE